MPVGDNFSSLQSALTAEKSLQVNSSQQALQMLLGVLQNNKALQAQERRFKEDSSFRLMQMEKDQELFDLHKEMKIKGLEAEASKIEYDKTRQLFDIEQFRENLSLRKRGMAVDETNANIMAGNDKARNERLGMESSAKVRRLQMEDEEIARGQDAQFQSASDYAQVLNDREGLKGRIKVEKEKHWFNGSEDLDKWGLELEDLDEKILKIEGNKGLKNSVVYKTKGGYTPILPKPQQRSSSSAFGAGNFDSESAASMEGIVNRTSRPLMDDRIPIVKKLMDQGMSYEEATLRARQIAIDQAQGEAIIETSPFENMVQ